MHASVRKKIIFFAILISVFVGLRFSPLAQYITFENIQRQSFYLQTLVQRNYFLTVFFFILVYIASVTLSLPGAAGLTLLAGFLFGVLPAVLFVNIGATAGACGAFFASRYFFGEFIQKKYRTSLQKFNNELRMYGHNYLLVLRLIPVFPFFLINLFAGLTAIPFKTFFWTTALGIIPGSFVFAFAGRQLATIKNTSDIFSFNILLMFIFLGLLALIPVAVKKVRGKK